MKTFRRDGMRHQPKSTFQSKKNNLLKKDMELSKYNKIKKLQSVSGSEFRRKQISLYEIALDYNVMALSPREMLNLSFELYSSGYLDRDQHLELSFQAELQPAYDTTIGALTGKKAAPDDPKDFTTEWQKRLIFEQTYPGLDTNVVPRVEGILEILMLLKLMQILC